MRLFISAGEASGDAYAAALVLRLRELLREGEEERVREALTALRYWPKTPTGSTPATSDEKSQRAFSEALSYELSLFQIQSRPEFDELWQLPWEEISSRLYQLLTPVERSNLGSLLPEGIGGPKLRAAGASIVADSSHWGAISIVQALKLYPKVVGGYYAAKKHMTWGKPGLFIPIDFGYANIRLARHAKNIGWKVLYFVPPGSWRRDRQGNDLPQITDAISTPFRWSAELLKEMGANAYWFGHPVKELIRDGNAHEVRGQSVAVLPGSRTHEIDRNLPVIAEAIAALANTIEFALAPAVDRDSFAKRWQELTSRTGDTFTQGDVPGVLRRARAAIVCSGTATLESSLCRCPTVVVYRLTKGMEIEAKILRALGLFKVPKFISLPNILLDRLAIPELVHLDANGPRIREELDRILEEGPAREAQLSAFDDLDELLGPADAITKTAELAARFLRPASSSE